MDNGKIRTPKQERSKKKKEQILNTAYEQICLKGYFHVTTNDIAKEAGVHISTLYSYFKDKEDILLQLMEGYNKKFRDVYEFKYQDAAINRENFRNIIKGIINSVLRLHLDTKEFNKELQILYYDNLMVRNLLDGQRKKLVEMGLSVIEKMKDTDRLRHEKIAAALSVELISATVEQIIYNQDINDKDILIEECSEFIFRYFYKD